MVILLTQFMEHYRSPGLPPALCHHESPALSFTGDALDCRVHSENKNSFVSPVYMRYCTSGELLPELKVLYKIFEKTFTGKPDKEQLIGRELRDHLVVHLGRLDEETFRKLYAQVLRK